LRLWLRLLQCIAYSTSMNDHIPLLGAWLGVILLGCIVFTNAVEWLGRRLNMGEGAVGSVFAAVGTAAPETIVGLAAILLVGKGAGHEIGVGAILGAPLLLSTLAMPITGIAVLASADRRPQRRRMEVNLRVLRRDLRWFYILFAAVILVSIHPIWPLRIAAALLIASGYVYYVRLHLKEAAEEHAALAPLYFAPSSALPSSMAIGAQCLISLSAILVGAYLFAQRVKVASAAWGVSPEVIALILAPIATELPEKMNSVIWVRQGKDTLALGNITGAMVFQGSVPVVLGMLLTAWNLDRPAFAAMLCAVAAASVLSLNIGLYRRLSPAALIACGAFYLTWVSATFWL